MDGCHKLVFVLGSSVVNVLWTKVDVSGNRAIVLVIATSSGICQCVAVNTPVATGTRFGGHIKQHVFALVASRTRCLGTCAINIAEAIEGGKGAKVFSRDRAISTVCTSTRFLAVSNGRCAQTASTVHVGAGSGNMELPRHGNHFEQLREVAFSCRH